jgi:hypothetical protein
LRDRFQHIPRTGDVRQIDFGSDFFFAPAGARTGFAAGRRTVSGGADIHPHLLGFMLFQRTGVRLLLGDSHDRKRIQNSFAFYFQLSG